MPEIDPLEQVDETLALNEIIFCDTSCGSNADPADGFGYCTCGQEAILKQVQQLIEREKKLSWTNGRDTGYAAKAEKADKEIAQAYEQGRAEERQRLLELIGEDEDVMRFYMEGGGDIAHGRNKLRAEIRSALLSEEGK